MYLLYPFSLLFTYLTNRRRRKYIKNKVKSFKPDIPVIVVGNLTIGGTGKTPLVKYITRKLINKGYKPGIVSRGYGGNFKETLQVSENTPVKETGDEGSNIGQIKCAFYI